MEKKNSAAFYFNKTHENFIQILRFLLNADFIVNFKQNNMLQNEKHHKLLLDKDSNNWYDR